MRSSPDRVKKKILDFVLHLDLTTDTGLSEDLYLYGIREKESVSYIKNNILKKNDVVVDIGGNIGYYTLLESSIIGADGIVYSLEPVHETFVKLKQNVELNQAENVMLYNYAIGNTTGTAPIYVGKKKNLSSLIMAEEKRYENTQSVQVHTLDDFMVDKPLPNFIRMDVEGYEHSILIGAQKILKNADRLSIHIELHPDIMNEKQTAECLHILETSGLNIVTIIHEPYAGWLNKSGEILPLIRKLTQHIGDTEKLGGAQEVTYTELSEILIGKRKQLRVIFSK